MNEPVPVVVLSTADFRSAVWTNKQHLAVRLAASREVVYIESFGLRRPTFSKADLARILRRLSAPRTLAAQPMQASEVQGGPRVVSPVVVPLHGARWVRRLNAWLVDRFVRPRLPEDYVLWSFSPLTYGLERNARAFVYHSVDLIHHQPDFPRRTIVTAERRCVRRADAVIASSIGVRDHLRSLGASEVRLWENVADTMLFSAPPPRRTARAVFAGHLTTTKIDITLLQEVVDQGTELIVCGPLPADGTLLPPEVEALLAHPRVDYRGNRTPAELADIFAECEVGLIPYALNPYTQGVFPLKVYEYLASGLAVVSTPLPSLADVPESMVMRASGADFGGAVSESIASFTQEGATIRRRFAAGHSWESRATEAERLLTELTGQA